MKLFFLNNPFHQNNLNRLVRISQIATKHLLATDTASHHPSLFSQKYFLNIPKELKHYRKNKKSHKPFLRKNMCNFAQEQNESIPSAF